MDAMKYHDLRDFLTLLEQQGELKRISLEVDPHLEITEIADRTLRAGGPALLFENPKGYSMPVLCNLFGTPKRVAMGMGQEDVSALREVGKLLAFLKEPEPPKGFRDLFDKLPQFKQVLNMPTKRLRGAPCQQKIIQGDDVDLNKIPIMTCWPEDAAPLITWGLTVTRGPHKERQNLGIYRQQLIGKNKLIMRWLSHRGGALDYQEWCAAHPGERFPVSVALGADPATILGAVTPVPDTLSEYAFAGLLRGTKTEVVKCISNDLEVPASAEIVLEGYIEPGELAPEGPYGDHTGYYNSVEAFPVMRISAITHRRDPVFHTIVPAEMEHLLLGSIPREATLLAHLQRSFPNVLDVHLSIGGVGRYHLFVKIRKTHEGQPKNVICAAFGAHYDIKQVVVVDDDVEVHDPLQVEWAVATRFQADRDLVVIAGAQGSVLDPSTTVGQEFGENSAPPSHVQGISAKMGLDATKPVVYHEHVFTKVRVPGEDTEDLDGLFSGFDPETGTYDRSTWQYEGGEVPSAAVTRWRPCIMSNWQPR